MTDRNDKQRYSDGRLPSEHGFDQAKQVAGGRTIWFCFRPDATQRAAYRNRMNRMREAVSESDESDGIKKELRSRFTRMLKAVNESKLYLKTDSIGALNDAAEFDRLFAEQVCSSDFKGCRERARAGGAADYWELANLYYYGNGVSKKYNKAFRCYQYAAEQGYADAQCCLGVCCYLGHGVKKDKKQAKEWLMRAAQQGHQAARNDLLLWFKDASDGLQARKFQPTKEQIRRMREVCGAFAQAHEARRFAVRPNLLKRFGLTAQSVLLAYDDTLLQSGKKGFAITEKEMVCRGGFAAETVKLPMERFAKAGKITAGSSCVYLDDQVLAYCSNIEIRLALVSLYKELQTILYMP